jgi:hypothetical protein
MGRGAEGRVCPWAGPRNGGPSYSLDGTNPLGYCCYTANQGGGNLMKKLALILGASHL